ncbi:MAG: SIS domain-containing protein [Candidatus Aminicenantes bacterium]|nr:SIS domain-containing protein [Candidatus Aminicenantes bacterium]
MDKISSGESLVAAGEELKQLLDKFIRENEKEILRLIEALAEALRKGKKILIFGNGGSAAEAQHFAAELVNKFLEVRPPLRAMALSTDTSILTSIGNDTSFNFIFSRQIEALGDAGDIAIGLSTSGRSPNIAEALKAAKKKGLISVAITGEGGGLLGSLADYLITVPSQSTPRIQEVHLFLLHLLAESLEKLLF